MRLSLLGAAALLGPTFSQALVWAAIVPPPALAQPSAGCDGTMPGGKVSSTFDPVMKAVEPTIEIKVAPGRSKLLRARSDVRRTAVADARIVQIVQVAPREVMLLGKAMGRTDVTLWIGDKTPQPVVVVVRVAPN